ncbi:OLC1v1029440C1 [Oldenlandia corymbosa var. corymbosa]|uniref:OLC1v1029440C1 n=1 Tax=Oldenlandia corymbosa var. corymbosa TaxID=529605 RepID=A0AAV1CDV5_OLDCO|nr:OLC1v1029440C1 [Oldenlandia corymbosa var. corymbosa]
MPTLSSLETHIENSTKSHLFIQHTFCTKLSKPNCDRSISDFHRITHSHINIEKPFHHLLPLLLVLLLILFKKSIYTRMCVTSHNINYFYMHTKQSKRCRIHRLTRRMRCEEDVGKEMVLKNLKLYIENMSIIEENERLRKKASLLHQENLELMSELQKKFSQSKSHPPVSTPALLN